MSEEVKMPQMGESIAEGTIVKWLKQVGDSVKRDEPLFEISTDKVDAEIPAPSSGVLSEIKVQEGETVAVNTVVAVINGGEAKPGQPAKEEAPAPEQESKQEPKKAEAEPAPKQEQKPAPKQAEPAPLETKPEAPPPSASQPATASSATQATTAATADADASSREELRRTRSSPLVR